MRVIEKGPGFVSTRLKCHRCKSLLEIEPGDWKRGTYGSEEVCKCAVCEAEIVRPGTEYLGDF